MCTLRLLSLALLAMQFAHGQAGIIAVKESKSYSYPFDVKGELEVRTGAGSIDITGWDKPQIEIEALKHGQTKEDLARIEPQIEIYDKDRKAKIKVKALQPQVNATISYTIRVPYRTDIDKVETGSGTIKVTNITNDIDAESGAGAISVAGARKEVEAKTGAGNITISFAGDGYGKADSKSGSGSILIENAGGPIKAETASGNIQASSRVLSASDDIEIKSSAGNVTLSLPQGVNAKIEAETSMGSITGGNFPWERKKERLSALTGDKAVLRLGKAYSDIKLKTNAGSIDVRQQ